MGLDLLTFILRCGLEVVCFGTWSKCWSVPAMSFSFTEVASAAVSPSTGTAGILTTQRSLCDPIE